MPHCELSTPPSLHAWPNRFLCSRSVVFTDADGNTRRIRTLTNALTNRGSVSLRRVNPLSVLSARSFFPTRKVIH